MLLKVSAVALQMVREFVDIHSKKHKHKINKKAFSLNCTSIEETYKGKDIEASCRQSVTQKYYVHTFISFRGFSRVENLPKELM